MLIFALINHQIFIHQLNKKLAMKTLILIKQYIIKLFSIEIDLSIDFDCNFEKEIFEQLSKDCEL